MFKTLSKLGQTIDSIVLSEHRLIMPRLVLRPRRSLECIVLNLSEGGLHLQIRDRGELESEQYGDRMLSLRVAVDLSISVLASFHGVFEAYVSFTRQRVWSYLVIMTRLLAHCLCGVLSLTVFNNAGIYIILTSSKVLQPNSLKLLSRPQHQALIEIQQFLSFITIHYE